MDSEKYSLYQEEEFERYESLCMRCGDCCGANDGDPCADLFRNIDGKYFCRVYEQRIEQEHRTVSGKKFHCVPMKEIIVHFGARPNCAYARPFE